MKVKSISPVFYDKEYSLVRFEGLKKPLRISNISIARHSLSAGSSIGEDAISGILKEEEPINALNDAYRLLGVRQRSEHELRQALLRKRHSRTQVDRILIKLKEQGYVNDVKFSADWFGYRSRQGKGSLFIASELRKKGIDKNTVNGLIASSRENGGISEDIMRIAAKKAKSLAKYDERKRYSRMISFLSRMGYCYTDARNILKKLDQKVEDED
ncbi:MAG: regulatory protein RecX [Endomicrobiales bacterium]|nr:regulatory protein RecX [Endomicrobiales bacterium]